MRLLKYQAISILLWNLTTQLFDWKRKDCHKHETFHSLSEFKNDCFGFTPNINIHSYLKPDILKHILAFKLENGQISQRLVNTEHPNRTKHSSHAKEILLYLKVLFCFVFYYHKMFKEKLRSSIINLEGMILFCCHQNCLAFICLYNRTYLKELMLMLGRCTAAHHISCSIVIVRIRQCHFISLLPRHPSASFSQMQFTAPS